VQVAYKTATAVAFHSVLMT